MALSVLIVDDDLNFRRALAIALRLEGVRVVEASSTEEALLALSSGSYEVTLVHLLLPDDALALIARIRRQWPSCKTAVCSAHPELLESARRQISGLIELEKPFTAQALLRAVDA